MPDSLRRVWEEENQGDYSISGFTRYSPGEYKQKVTQEINDETSFINWITSNAHEIKSVDAGNGFEDLAPFKSYLKDVRVIGMGEATHGTSEFFRMKHRMLEFLVKEMNCASFYIEASMSRCRYINDYVLYGKGNLDTATAIQGFTVWRVEEVRNLIQWMHDYNQSVSEEKKVKFFGFDVQLNNEGWDELKQFYTKVNPSYLLRIDTISALLDTAAVWSNDLFRMGGGTALYKKARQQCLEILNDIVLNEGLYRYNVGEEMYQRNLMNIKLIVQETASYSEIYNNLRDYYMAENILHLLNREKADTRVLVWAHNGHIEKDKGMMGGYLANTLGDQYYAIGFEFNSGSFQVRNLDLNKKTNNWGIMTFESSPEKSLAWYLDQAGSGKFFLDFRNTGTEKLKYFSKRFDIHSIGSSYSEYSSPTETTNLKDFDGLIYIKNSSPAKDFKGVILSK